jgi:hypothetical protein
LSHKCLVNTTDQYFLKAQIEYTILLDHISHHSEH